MASVTPIFIRIDMATPAVDRTKNFTLSDEWEEVFTGKVTVVLVSGSSYWVYNGPSAPPTVTRLRDFTPITGDFSQATYSYGGTQKTFCRIAGDNKGVVAATGLGNSTVVSVTPII